MEYEKACDSNNLFLKQRNELGRYSPLHTSKRQCPISAELKESIALLSRHCVLFYWGMADFLLFFLYLVVVVVVGFDLRPIEILSQLASTQGKRCVGICNKNTFIKKSMNVGCKLRLRFCADKSLIYIY